MSVIFPIIDLDKLPNEPAGLRARKRALEKDLDRMLQLRGPVAEVRRLVADLDRVAVELARSMRDDASEGASDHHFAN